MNATAKKTILICDDEPFVMETVKFLAARSGYRVIVARDGLSGIDKAKKERPDLLLLDVMMPGKNGYEVCRALKSDPATKDIYVIMLSGMTLESDKQLGIDAGANDYLTKPFSPRKLRSKLHEALGCQE